MIPGIMGEDPGNTFHEVMDMVKGISRQVIVVKPNDQKLFEEAIFILRDDAVREGITDDLLMQEAKAVLRNAENKRGSTNLLWAVGGALVTACMWIVSMIL